MPVLTPFELWQQSGRDYIQEIFRLKDRNGREYVLPMTHEETVTFHAKEIQSYRQLPQILYHFSIKERDEPRPRGGLLRLREFIMKDAYSFDRDEEGLDVSFRKHIDAYGRMFERCELEVYAVQAESGMMGGKESIDYLAPSGSGENILVTCERGDYAADLEIARGVPRAPEFPERLDAPAGGRDARRHDDRGARRVPRGRRGGDLEGDAGRRRLDGTRRAGARPRRRPARGGEAGDRARARDFRAVDGGRDPRGVRRRPRLARPRRLLGRGRRRTRRCARASSSPARTGRAFTSAASSTAATSRRASPTCASRARAIRARTAAARSASRRRSRSATSSSSGRATRSRSARPSWTRTARRSRSSAAATASGRRA